VKRIISAVILGGVVLYLILAAPVTAGVIGIAVIGLIGAGEMARLIESSGTPCSVPLVTAGSALLILGAWLGNVLGLSVALAVAAALLGFSILRSGEIEGKIAGISAGVFALLIPAWSLAHAIFFLYDRDGRHALLFLLLVIWTCDSAAFYAGSRLGKRKLAPKISPNKTVEGFAAGLLSSIPVAVIFYLLAPGDWGLGFLIMSAAGIALLGQAGDLVESALKRSAGVKDSGSLIPGHGGVLDRIDSLLFTLPLFYYLVAWSRGGF